MLTSLGLPLWEELRREYGSWENLRQDLQDLGCHGVEGVWSGEDIPADFPRELITGYHLTFYPDWLDFYRDDRAALARKYGSLKAAWAFYGGRGPETLLAFYRADLERALSLGARYMVFHVADVSIEEGYTYRWLHSDAEVIEAAAEVINLLLSAGEGPFEFLLENQWWPGFTFTQPQLTAALLDKVRYPRKGLMLDIGHLMNTNLSLSSQAQAAAYINSQLDSHGELCRYIRGVHLHHSLSGDYVKRHTGKPPEKLPPDPAQRFGVSYSHIQYIDQHRPWTDPTAAQLVERIDPAYLTHELAANSRRERYQAVCRQIAALGKGRIFRD